MMKLIRNFVRDEKGEDLIEYGLLAAFIAFIALAAIITDPFGLRAGIISAFSKAGYVVSQ